MSTHKEIGSNRIQFNHELEIIEITDDNDEDYVVIHMEDWHDIRLEIDKECGDYL